MAEKIIIATDNAPAAIGTYSQAVKVGSTVYLSGQIPLVPSTMQIVSDDFEAQVVQVFENLTAVCNAAGGSINDIVKLNIFLTDLSHFAKVNEIMSRYFSQPYPARAAIGVKQLPKDSQVEMDGVMELLARACLTKQKRYGAFFVALLTHIISSDLSLTSSLFHTSLIDFILHLKNLQSCKLFAQHHKTRHTDT